MLIGDNLEFKEGLLSQLSVFIKNDTIEKDKEELSEAIEALKLNVANMCILAQLKNLSPKEKTMVKLASYLWTFEGLYVGNVEIICFILIKNGHDLYNFFVKKYIKTFEDLDSVDIFTIIVLLFMKTDT
jgi:hypothetical protein